MRVPITTKHFLTLENTNASANQISASGSSRKEPILNGLPFVQNCIAKNISIHRKEHLRILYVPWGSKT